MCCGYLCKESVSAVPLERRPAPYSHPIRKPTLSTLILARPLLALLTLLAVTIFGANARSVLTRPLALPALALLVLTALRAQLETTVRQALVLAGLVSAVLALRAVTVFGAHAGPALTCALAFPALALLVLTALRAQLEATV